MCSAQLADRVDQLGISPGSHRRRRPARKLPYRGGRRQQGRTIPVIVSDRSRPLILHPLCTSTHDSVRHPTDKCSTAYGISYSNLIKIDTDPVHIIFIQEISKHFKVMFLKAQSVRNKVLDICDWLYITTECWPSFPVWNMASTRRRWGWLCSLDTAWFLFEDFSPTVWYRWWACCFTSSQSYQNKLQFQLEILYLWLLRW